MLEAAPCPLSSRCLVLATLDGKERWLDVAARAGRWDALPPECQGCVGLVLRDREPYLLRTPSEGRAPPEAQAGPPAEDGWGAAVRLLMGAGLFLIGFLLGRRAGRPVPPSAAPAAATGDAGDEEEKEGEASGEAGGPG
jgi:hypothetical protein